MIGNLKNAFNQPFQEVMRSECPFGRIRAIDTVFLAIPILWPLVLCTWLIDKVINKISSKISNASADQNKLKQEMS